MVDLNKLYGAILKWKVRPAVEVTHQIIDEKLDI